MKEIKDNFSDQSSNYASFRPAPPKDLFDFIYQQVTNFDTAWDCGTGNGQAAVKLAEKFKQVYATDISDKQLVQAEKKANIIYKKERAEETAFENDSIDLITVAQAIHWFDIPAFNKEVKRIGSKNAILAVWTYTLLRLDPEINKIIDHLYYDITYLYWDKERKLVDEGYSTIPFPFEEIITPKFEIMQYWKLEQVIGYLSTWSGVQHYINKEKKDPLNFILDELQAKWGADEIREVRFPLFIRTGRIK